ncbi:response regulator transcription factor [Shimia ponticola]|uniref:response regulator transcription factor n=1 Tax=Shimia ponticola TaxID=2582893 RepID=UPI0011BF01E2|nr:response regulator [Shimia ponticola]
MAHILIVEDDLRFAELLRDDLSERGHTLAIFSNTGAALKYLDAHAVDLILTDVFLTKEAAQDTKTGGITFVNQVRNINGLTVPIIAMSGFFGGFAAGQKQGTLKTVGADAVLSKPFTPDELVVLMDKLLGG